LVKIPRKTMEDCIRTMNDNSDRTATAIEGINVLIGKSNVIIGKNSVKNDNIIEELQRTNNNWFKFLRNALVVIGLLAGLKLGGLI